MVKPDLNFRPNPARAVYVFGPLDDALLSKIVPQIAEFRQRNGDPITVFIHSPGGVIRSLEVLTGCLSETDVSPHNCRIITVASGDAASAAAALLALGDYAYAYPRTEIHFHGARFFEVETVTTESASTYAAYLANRNRQIAFRLANSMIRRLAHRYSILCEDFEKLRQKNPEITLSELDCFVHSVLERLGDKASQVVKETYKKTKSALALAQSILANVEFSDGQAPLQQDANVFRAVIDYELGKQNSDEWRFDEYGCSQITSDYLLLRDYELGEHKNSVDWIVQNLGFAFLTLNEFNELRKKEGQTPEEAAKYQSSIVTPRVKPFWYFTVCLCRQLQEGENRISPEDAYWLGAVDEVVGTDLFGFRAIMERDPDDIVPSES